MRDRSRTAVRSGRAWIFFGYAPLVGVLVWAASAAAEPATLRTQAKAIFGTLPADAASEERPMTKARVELGRILYYDVRLSKNQDVSCNSCHLLDRFGVDGEPTSPGHQGQRGERNSPTTFNAALHLAQFWDGRAADVEAQAKGPVLNPIEMAMPSEAAVVGVLQSIPGYEPLFKAAFPADANAITYDNVATAIGAFERGLITRDRFDRFQEGDDLALSEEELAGLELFASKGCASCHIGAAIGGGMYRVLGQVEPYPTEDTGREQVTGKKEDRFVFKVPSLRNVAETGPWLHDGSVASLDEAVAIMARHQLGSELNDEDRRAIVSFLGSLTGEVDADYTAMPMMPTSGPKTPAPDPS